MRVLGLTEVDEGYSKQPAYIVVIAEDELKMVANKAGYREEFPKLKVGDEYPIAEGFNFRAEIKRATEAMVAAYQSFQKSSETMSRFAALMASRSEDETP